MSLLNNLVNKGELPQVKVNVSLDRETLTDVAITALIVAVLVTLMNKYLLSKL